MSSVETIHALAKRFKQVLKHLDLSVYDFALSIGDQRSEKANRVIRALGAPSFDMMYRMKETYPDLNLNWLISGKGEMLLSKTIQQPKPIETVASKPNTTLETKEKTYVEPVITESTPLNPSKPQGAKVVRVENMKGEKQVITFKVKTTDMWPTLGEGDLIRAVKTDVEELTKALNQGPLETPIFPLFEKEKFGPYPIVVLINPPIFDFLLQRLVSIDELGYLTMEGDHITSNRTKIKPRKAELWAVIEIVKRS